MKKMLTLLLICFVVISCGSQSDKSTSQDDSSATENIVPANLETIEIAVYGMTCGGCENTVKTAVGKLPGVQSVKASHTDSTAIVTFDKTKVDFEQMKVVITDKGYQAVEYKLIK